MAHPRKLIRSEVETRLNADASLTALGLTFTRSVAASVAESSLPAGFVYTEGDEISQQVTGTITASQRSEYRTLALVVVIQDKAKLGATVQDWLDDAAEHVERVLYEDATQGGNAIGTTYQGASPVSDSSSQTIAGSIALRFSIVYGVTYSV